MPRHHKANKRAASRRHQSATASRRPLRSAGITQPKSAASVTPTQTRAAAPMKAAPIPQSPAAAPAPDSPLSHHLQHHRDAQNHCDRRAHPDQAALKERAFTLSCIGLRSPAIAEQLGVSERTIRHWNHATLRTLALDASRVSPDLDLDPTAHSDASVPSDAAAPDPDPDLMEYDRALAIERQLDIAVTARAAYDRLMAQHDHLLAQFIAACDANVAATVTAAAAPTSSGEASAAPSLPDAVASMARLIPQLASSASRQLQIAQAAHREVARLQGVTTYARTDARLCAERDHKQAEQAAAPAEEQGGLVPIHFFDPNAALDAICGPDDYTGDTGDTLTRGPEDDRIANLGGVFPRHRFTKADAEAAIDDITGGPNRHSTPLEAQVARDTHPSPAISPATSPEDGVSNISGISAPRSTLAARYMRDPNYVY